VKLREIADDTIAHATGRAHRADEVRPGTGGPLGNARLTAWVGLALLVAFAAELVTLLDVRGLLAWHVAIGILLIPPAIMKTASTGWRILRYYTGNGAYRRAGPPPFLFRVVGPLVVVTTLGVLGSGLVLILLGPDASRQPQAALFGHTVDLLMLHKGAFVLWGVVTGLHVLGRLVPAWQATLGALTRSGGVPGRWLRGVALAITATVAIGVTVMTVSLVDTSGWGRPEFGDRPRPGTHSSR
jgi:hypothetical protein